jgi:hypothetical protein
MELSKKMKDITGSKFGSLLAIRPAYLNANGCVVWEWLCDCGNTHQSVASSVKSVAKQAINKQVPSCGCVKKERAVETNTLHGYSRHPLYAVWQSMKQRCYTPAHKSYYLYGAKGVTVCDEWLNSPETFIDWAISEGWVAGMHLDKDILSDTGGTVKMYSPSTCMIISGGDNVKYSSSRSNYKNNPKIKITPQQVVEIVRLYNDGMRQRTIAKMYGVSQSTIQRITST